MSEMPTPKTLCFGSCTSFRLSNFELIGLEIIRQVMGFVIDYVMASVTI